MSIIELEDKLQSISTGTHLSTLVENYVENSCSIRSIVLLCSIFAVHTSNEVKLSAFMDSAG